jgi:hypothetical protein
MKCALERAAVERVGDIGVYDEDFHVQLKRRQRF